MLSTPDVALSQDRLAQLEAIRQRCDEEWSAAHLFWFTDHGPKHAARVLGLIQEFVQATPEAAWSSSELLVLAACALLHDVGMQHLGLTDELAGEYTFADWDALRSEHALVSSLLIRADYEHALGISGKSKKGKRGNPRPLTEHHLNLGIKEPAIGKAIALTCRGHAGKHFRDVCASYEASPLEPLPGERFRGDLVTAVLLIADEMDLHNARSSIQDLQHYSPETRMHHLTHHYVDGAHFVATEEGVEARVNMSFPTDSPWRSIFETLVSRKLESQLRLLQDVFSRHRIRVSPRPRVNTSLEADGDGFKLADLDDSDVAYAKQTLLRLQIANEKDAVRALTTAIDEGSVLEVAVSDELALDEYGAGMLRDQVFSWIVEYCRSRGSEPVVIRFGDADGAATDLPDVVGSVLSMPGSQTQCTTASQATSLVENMLQRGFVPPPVVLVDPSEASAAVRGWIETDLLAVAIAERFPLVLLDQTPSGSGMIPRVALKAPTQGDWHSFARLWGVEPACDPDIASALAAAGGSYGAGWYAVRVRNAQLAGGV